MIKKIEIDELFEHFTYCIDFFDNLTILSGPNGFGKSTILHIINAIGNGNLFYFMSISFEKIVVTFRNEKVLRIFRNKGDLYFDELKVDMKIIENFRRSSRNFYRYTENLYYHKYNSSKISDIDDFLEMIKSDNILFSNLVSSIDLENESVSRLKKKIDEMIKNSGKVKLITEQRLIKTAFDDAERSIKNNTVISTLPNEFIRLIGESVQKYTQIAGNLDSTFPVRLIKERNWTLDSDTYKDEIKEINKKFKRIIEYKLVDMTIIDELTFDEKYSKAIKIYFNDFNKKYKMLESLLDKLDLFTRIINGKLTNKRVKINPIEGLIIEDINGSSIPLAKLSSGEQQEILLYFEMIFMARNELLLIDEPEISLHVLWQKSFIPDLIEIAEMNILQAIVATHSPQIINKHWEALIDLGEEFINDNDSEIA